MNAHLTRQSFRRTVWASRATWNPARCEGCRAPHVGYPASGVWWCGRSGGLALARALTARLAQQGQALLEELLDDQELMLRARLDDV